jgi:hypothetical protein
MTKSFFWPIFKVAWDKAFTEDNIQSAFRKAGIWPTDSVHVITAVTRPTILPPQKAPGILKAPRSAKSIRHYRISYEREPTEGKVQTLFTATLELSAQVAVLQHQNRGLLRAIDLQKKKNKRGVRLNLCGKENKGIIDYYSPSQVVKAREFTEQKEAEKEAEEKRKYDNRVKRAANTLRKAQEAEEKATKAAAAKLVADLTNAAEAVKKARKSQPKSVATKAKKAAPTVPKARKAPVKARLPPKSPVKRVLEPPIVEVGAPVVAVTKRSNRAIKLPTRFLEKI